MAEKNTKNSLYKIITFILLIIGSSNLLYIMYNAMMASLRYNGTTDVIAQQRYFKAWENLQAYSNICHTIAIICIILILVLLIISIINKNKKYILVNIISIIISLFVYMF